MTAALAIEGLSVRYGEFEAVREAWVSLDTGRTLTLVGESGSGKSTLAHAVARLLPPEGRIAGGTIRAGDVAVESLAGRELRRFRGSVVGYLAQDAMAALNPVARAGRQVAEVLEARSGTSRRAARAGALELLRQVGVQDPERVARAYPHELSGGMRQRVMIAMAFGMRPSVLVADEPTTALDVTVQAEILALARTLQAEHGTAFLWITHDMGVVAEIADDVAVMYGGRIVEHGPAAAVFARPAHPYTAALLETVASARAGDAKTPFAAIAGQPPSDIVPAGCPFHPRCPRAFEPCPQAMPPVTEVGAGHRAACHLLGSAA